MRRVGLVLVLAIGLGTLLPGCPFFTRQDRAEPAAPAAAPAEAAH